MQHDPSSGVEVGQVMHLYTAMVATRAKNPAETGKLLSEMVECAMRVVELTGKEIRINHAKSVMLGILDEYT